MIITSTDNINLLNWDEDVTLKNIEGFRDAMKHLIESNSEKIVLNLKEVQYVNSGALGVIADSVMTAGKYQKELVVSVTQRSVREIFNIVKFNSFIKIFDSQEEALHYFKCDDDE